MFELIVLLQAIYGFAKNCHYKSKGSSFFGEHLLADRVIDNLDTINNYIDSLNECAYMGREQNPPLRQDIYINAADVIPEISEDGHENFLNLYELFTSTLEHIEELDSLEELTVGDRNLIGGIAQDLQQSKGLLWRQIL